MPFIETPYWCLELTNEEYQFNIIYDCQVKTDNYIVQYSQIVDLNPVITGTLDILCLAFLAYFRWFKSTWAV